VRRAVASEAPSEGPQPSQTDYAAGFPLTRVHPRPVSLQPPPHHIFVSFPSLPAGSLSWPSPAPSPCGRSRGQAFVAAPAAQRSDRRRIRAIASAMTIALAITALAYVAYGSVSFHHPSR
jgi:hypothetical protein